MSYSYFHAFGYNFPRSLKTGHCKFHLDEPKPHMLAPKSPCFHGFSPSNNCFPKEAAPNPVRVFAQAPKHSPPSLPPP